MLAPAGDTNGADRTPFLLVLAGPIKQGATPTYYVDAAEGSASLIQSAADFHVRLENTFVDADKGIHVVATVTNSGATTMTVPLTVGLYDQAGTLLAVSEGQPPLILVAGASSPAAFNNFGAANGNVDLFNKVVSYTVQVDPSGTIPYNAGLVTLQTSNVTTDTSGGGVTIKGELINTTTKDLDQAHIVVALHDHNGKLVAADWTTVGADSGLFAPKAKLAWNIHTQLPANLDPTSLTYDTIVQGDVHK